MCFLVCVTPGLINNTLSTVMDTLKIWITHRDRQPLALTFKPTGNLESPSNRTPLTAWIWTLGGSRRSQRDTNMGRTCKRHTLDGGFKHRTLLLWGNSANLHICCAWLMIVSLFQWCEWLETFFQAASHIENWLGKAKASREQRASPELGSAAGWLS